MRDAAIRYPDGKFILPRGWAGMTDVEMEEMFDSIDLDEATRAELRQFAADVRSLA